MRSSLGVVLVLLAVATVAPPSASATPPAADAQPGAKTEYLRSGTYARDVVAAAAPATAWIHRRSDQLVHLTTACRAAGRPVGHARSSGPRGASLRTSGFFAAGEPASAGRPSASAARRRAARARRAHKRRAAVRRRARARRAASRRRHHAQAVAAAEDAAARKASVPSAAACAHIPVPAVVFDIDETLLSNYIGVPDSNPENGSLGQFPGVLGGSGTAMPGVADAYREAQRRSMAVFVISARPSFLFDTTVANLHRAGYDGWAALSLKSDGTAANATFKTGVRADIESRGYTIVANVGDQASDLAGGHSERTFKLPNPFYTG